MTANGTSSADLEHLRKEYAAAGQSHVFTFYDKLSPAEQTKLLNQLKDIDVHRVNRIYANAVAADGPVTPPSHSIPLDDSLAPGGANMVGRSRTPSPGPKDEVMPLPDSATATIVGNPKDEAKWRDIGLQAIADGEVAVLLMAGGQGTRLGSSSPKGMYDIQLPSGMTLFELQAGRIKKLEEVAAKKAGKDAKDVSIRWYVMTSGPTRGETEKYFNSKNFFGLKKENVIFFEQGKSKASILKQSTDHQASCPLYQTMASSCSRQRHPSVSLLTETAVCTPLSADHLPPTRQQPS